MRQPFGDAPARLDLAQPVGQGLGVEEMRLEEAPDGLCRARLVARQKRGMGDRQTQRMAEQRLDREPVGQAADNARLGHRPDKVHRGAVAGEMRGEEDRRHQAQHRRRQPAHLRQRLFRRQGRGLNGVGHVMPPLRAPQGGTARWFRRSLRGG